MECDKVELVSQNNNLENEAADEARRQLELVKLIRGQYRDFLPYNNKDHKYNMLYPNDWIREDVAKQIRKSDISALFLAPDWEQNGSHMLITKDDRPLEMGYEESMFNSIEEVYCDLVKYCNDSKIEEKGRISFNNMNGYKMVFSGNLKGSKVYQKWLKFFYIFEGKIFKFTYLAKLDKFDEHLENAMKMIKSFRPY